MEIHLGLGNANILLAQLLLHLPENGFQLLSFDGGSLRNAIPREAKAFVAIDASYSDVWQKLKDEAAELKRVYSATDPNFHFSVEEVPSEMNEGLSTLDTFKVLNSIAGCANGVFRLSSAVPGLVETSSNLARIEIGNGLFRTLSLQRSSIDHSRDWAAQSVGASFKAIGASVTHTGHYPGWQPRSESKVLNMMVEKYQGLFGSEPRVTICHAGLECGIIGERYPEMEMISYGPTIKGAHSPDERVSISSVEKFWSLTLETLKVL